MNDKIKQAFEECEKFINECTPEELREYEKNLNLDYDSYYSDERVSRNEISKLHEDIEYYQRAITGSRSDLENTLNKLVESYSNLLNYQLQLSQSKERLMGAEVRLTVEHPELLICKNCKYCSTLDEFADEKVVNKLCCTFANQQHRNICVVNENGKCENFELCRYTPMIDK